MKLALSIHGDLEDRYSFGFGRIEFEKALPPLLERAVELTNDYYDGPPLFTSDGGIHGKDQGLIIYGAKSFDDPSRTILSHGVRTRISFGGKLEGKNV